MAKFVLDELEHQKKRINNNMDIKELARKIASDLFGAFSWANTKEGYNYWADVYIKLRRIAEEGF